ncbi:MAG TPA: hypothetical protein VMZ00_10140 [Sporichthya sp.]|nr:hypothetical protein [Sporichthya sp.]
MTLSSHEERTLAEIGREFSRRDPELHRRLSAFDDVSSEPGDAAIPARLSASVRAAGWPAAEAGTGTGEKVRSPWPSRRRNRLAGIAFTVTLLGALGLPVLALNTADLGPGAATQAHTTNAP